MKVSSSSWNEDSLTILRHRSVQPWMGWIRKPCRLLKAKKRMSLKQILLTIQKQEYTIQSLHDDGGGTLTGKNKEEEKICIIVRNVYSKRQQNFSIPSHHPSVPGTVASAAVLSTIWDHLRRLATHLLENDVNTTETLGNLMSEAALDGCLPFNSHLHMDFSNAWLQGHHSTPAHYQAVWET